MQTFQYRPGWFIHVRFFDRSPEEVRWQDQNDNVHKAKTVIGAKRAITRALRGE